MKHIEPSHYEQTQDWYNVISYIVPEAVYVLLLVKYLNVFLFCVLETIQSKWTISMESNQVFWFNMDLGFLKTSSNFNRLTCQAIVIQDCFHNNLFVSQQDNLSWTFISNIIPLDFQQFSYQYRELRHENGLLASLASAPDGQGLITWLIYGVT